MSRIAIWILFAQLSLSCAPSKKLSVYDEEIHKYRSKYKHDFIQNPRSPLAESDLAHLDFFPPDSAWKWICTCTRVQDAAPFEMPTYSGVTRTYILYARTECSYKNKTINLNLYKNIHQPVNPLYKNHLFLPFKDSTNGEETYGGGRYINLLDTDIVENKIVIDFNKCYNPYCAYSDGYNCPIPPKENHLDIPVHAGEKKYTGPYKKAKP